MRALYIIICVGLLGVIMYLVLTPGQQRPNTPAAQSSPAIRYLPLGDSYTIGQSVSQDERWPNQLVSRLQKDSIDIDIVANQSETGYTTQDLIAHELPLLETTKPNFVTVLIGVNDYVQGVPEATFQKNFRMILDTILGSVSKDRIIVVTIPDYGKTPAGAQFGDPTESAQAIKQRNDFMMQEAMSRGISTVDIYAVSQQVSTDQTLVASDGLHPSGKQYSLWTDLIYGAIKAQKSL